MALKLLELRNKEQEIINDIINFAQENQGEINSETEKNLEVTKKDIIKSIDSYAYVLKYKIKEEREYWKTRKAEADTILKRIDNKESYLKQQLHSIATEEDLVGESYTIKPDSNTSRSIIIDLVEENIGEYTVKMTPEAFLRHFKDNPEDYISVTRKVLLNELPDDHKAIESEVTPTIKIVKTK